MEKREVFLQGLKKVGPFVNEETGEKIEGYNAFYVDLEPANKENYGYLPAKKFLTVPEGENLKSTGLGIYNLLLKLDLSNNRPRISVEGFEFLRKLEPDFEN